jgi:hypothetical protein
MAEPSIVVEKNVVPPMRDGVVLRADVYRPAAVGKEFAKLRGARTLFESLLTLIVTKSAKFLGKIDNPSS